MPIVDPYKSTIVDPYRQQAASKIIDPYTESLRLKFEPGVYPIQSPMERRQEVLAPMPAGEPAAPAEIPGVFSQFLKGIVEKSGVTQPGVVRKAIGAVSLPFIGAAETLNLPERLIHGYDITGEGIPGPGLGDIAVYGTGYASMLGGLAGGGGKAMLPIMRQARNAATKAALRSPEVLNILKDVRTAAQRGEMGFVGPTAVEQLLKQGIPGGAVKQIVKPFVENTPVLGNVGKARFPALPKAQAAIDDVLARISVGDRAATHGVTASDLYRDYVDELNPLKKLLDATAPPSVKQIQRDWAKAIKRGEEGLVSGAYQTMLRATRAYETGENPYEIFRLLPGSWGKVDSFLSYKTFDISSLQFKGKSLSSILKPIRGDMNNFRAYYMARQVVDLEKAGIPTGFNIAKSQGVVRSLGKQFRPYADELTKYNNTLLKTLLDSGIISAEEYKKMVIFHKHYAPMFRVVPDQEAVFSRTAAEAIRQRLQGVEAGKPLKRLTGSKARVIDPLESVIRNTYIYIRAADRNLAMRSLLDYAKRNPQFGSLFKRVENPAAVVEDVIDIPDKLMLAEMQALKISPSTLRALSPSGFLPKTNTVAVWENGIRTMYEVHSDIARVVKAMDKPEIGMWTKLLGTPARLLRAGATLSPEFIARNPLRDQLSAAIFSRYGYIPGFDFAKGVFKVFKQDDLYWKWKIAGGEHSMLVGLDRADLQKDLVRVLSKYQSEGLIADKFNGWHILDPIHALQVLSMTGEKGTRLGEFLRANAKLGNTKAALQKAAFASREVSLDFARAGTRGRAINMLVAFWNAQVQGVDKLARSFAEAPFRTSAKLAAYITVPSLLLAMSNVQDGRWRDFASWEKDLFWLIPTGFVSREEWDRMTPAKKAEFAKKNPVWRIPKPFELGVIFGSIPERLVEYVHEKDPKAITDTMMNAVEAVVPGILPTAALPFVEVAANRSFLTGGRLVPRGQEDILPAEQRRSDTSNLAMHLSRVVADIAGNENTVSPIYIDNVIRGWTGGLGTYVVLFADESLKVAGVDPNIPNPDMFGPRSYPFIRGLVSKYPSGSSLGRLFDETRKQERLLNTIRAKFNEGDVKGLEYMEEVDARVAALTQTRDAVVMMLQFAEKIRRHPAMDMQAKRQLIDSTIFQAIAISNATLKFGKTPIPRIVAPGGQ